MTSQECFLHYCDQRAVVEYDHYEGELGPGIPCCIRHAVMLLEADVDIESGPVTITVRVLRPEAVPTQ